MTTSEKIRYLFNLDGENIKNIVSCEYKLGDIVLRRYSHAHGACFIRYKDMDYRFYGNGKTYPKIEDFPVEIIEIVGMINSLYRKEKIRKILEDDNCK